MIFNITPSYERVQGRLEYITFSGSKIRPGLSSDSYEDARGVVSNCATHSACGTRK